MVTAGGAAAASLWPTAPAELHEQAGVHFHRDPGGWFRRYASGEMDFVAMRAARVAQLMATFGLEELEDAHGRFERAFAPAFRDALRLFDDVDDLLRAAARAALPVGLLTNSAAHATAEKLEVLELAGAFPVVVTTDALGVGKPDPRAFLHACERMGSEPARTAYVGDDLVVDALAAREAGLSGIWLDRRGTWAGDDVGVPVVPSLGRLGRLLTDDGTGDRAGD
jgi:putative hydrolase of the HAD superfamily